jgi:hypothetical protein
MIPTTPFAWSPTDRTAPASNVLTRRSNSASSVPPARPGRAPKTRITSLQPRRRLRRRNRRRPSNRRSRRSQRNWRSQRNRSNHRRRRNLRHRRCTERAAPIPVQQVIRGSFLVLGNAAPTSACGTWCSLPSGGANSPGKHNSYFSLLHSFLRAADAVVHCAMHAPDSPQF